MKTFENLKIEILNSFHLSEVLKSLTVLGYELSYKSDDFITNSIRTYEDGKFHMYTIHISELNESGKSVTLNYLLNLGNNI